MDNVIACKKETFWLKSFLGLKDFSGKLRNLHPGWFLRTLLHLALKQLV